MLLPLMIARALHAIRTHLPLIIVVFALAFSAGWFSHGQMRTGAFVPIDPPLRAKSEYKYVNPLLTCGTWESKDFDEYTPLKKKVQNFIASMIDADKAEKVGVYFRELKGGHWFGVNENSKFSPASLLKVPVMIAYLKSAEKTPGVLGQSLYYDGSFDLNENEHFRSPYWIKPNRLYTVHDLLSAMIVNSDNNATQVLDANINHSSLLEVFTDLGLSIPADDAPEIDFMSPKSFTYFFRVLYNATYLSDEFSEKALNLLAGPDFPRGIQSTVPAGVTVAQKFGERSVFNSLGVLQSRELHDCGIIYYPAKPYLLCVMTKGKDFADLTSIIQNISSMTYEEMDNGK